MHILSLLAIVVLPVVLPPPKKKPVKKEEDTASELMSSNTNGTKLDMNGNGTPYSNGISTANAVGRPKKECRRLSE